MVKMYVLF